MIAQDASIPGVDLDVDHLLRLRLLLQRTAARRLATSRSSAAVARRRRGRGAETFDVRPWSDGDDIRYLDRNATARTGAPHVRTFHEERERSVVYLIDFRPSMLFGTRRAFRSVAAAEAAVILAWRTLDAQGRVGIAVASASQTRFLGWATSARAFAPLLDQLAAAHRDALDATHAAEPALAGALDAIGNISGAAAVTVASAMDAPGDDFDGVAERIARRRALDILLVVDRFQIAPPLGVYSYRTREGDAGRLRITEEHQAPATDARKARLREIGARVLEIDAGLGPAATACALERFDG